MAMAKYRNKNQHREALSNKIHPKIFVWSHTKKAEIEYFQEFKNYFHAHLLMPKKKICGSPQGLIAHVIDWKNKGKIDEEDNDQVWCIFDVDDFYQKNKKELLQAIKNAHRNNIKIAYINECFELWILLHFEMSTAQICRGNKIENKIQKTFKKNKLGEFKKNQKVFKILLPFQSEAIKNARQLLSVEYNKIDWKNVLSEKGNPSTSIHFLIEEINKLVGGGK